MSGRPASREPGVSRINGTPAVAGWANRSRNASTPMWPSPMVWCRSLNAPRDVHRVVGVHQPQPAGPADLDDPVEGRGRAAGLVERRAGGEDVTGVQADAGLRVAVEGVEVRREVLDAGAQRPALPGGRLEQQPRRGVVGDRVEHRQQSLADLAHRGVVPVRRAARVDVRPGVHDDALGADLGGAAEVVGDRRHRLLVRRGGRAAEVHEVRRVDERPGAGLRAGLPEPRVLAGSPADSAQPRGLPTNTWSVSQPISRALGERAVDEPLADRDVGADRVAQRPGRGASGAAAGMPRRLSTASRHKMCRVAEGQTTMRTTVLPLRRRRRCPGRLLHHPAEADVVRVLLDLDLEARRPRSLAGRRRRCPARGRRGTSTSSGPSETVSSTSSPLKRLPVLGVCWMTSPSATCRCSPRCGSTSRPCFASAASALSASLPVQSTTLIGRGPRLSRMSTAAPGLSGVPALGLLPMTWPSGIGRVVRRHGAAELEVPVLDRGLRLVLGDARGASAPRSARGRARRPRSPCRRRAPARRPWGRC